MTGSVGYAPAPQGRLRLWHSIYDSPPGSAAEAAADVTRTPEDPWHNDLLLLEESIEAAVAAATAAATSTNTTTPAAAAAAAAALES